MFIRKLQSTLIRDYLDELYDINQHSDPFSFIDVLNPSLTFKFCELTPDEMKNLCSLLEASHLPFYKSGKSQNRSVIASFFNWDSMTDFFFNAENLESLYQGLMELEQKIQMNEWEYQIKGDRLSIKRPLIMGILNVTPDSFSDGGKFLDSDKAYNYALEMQEAGADIIDIGAESTRPGSQPVNLEEEWQRLEPVLKKLQNEIKVPISIDTYKSDIARRALQEGAQIINDISGLTFDPRMTEIAATADCPVIIMHIKGTPRNMQENPRYKNLMEEIFKFFLDRIQFAKKAGIQQLILDPGIGFGKRFEDNFELIRRLSEFRILGYPIMVGPSRKSFIGKVLDTGTDDRLFGTAASVALAISNGTNIVRVHDIHQMKQVVKISTSIENLKFFD